jgi:hypothetical protein
MFQFTARNAAGYVIKSGGDGRDIEHDTQQCCHCGKHFILQPGSGTIRGFCRGCMGMTCGNPACIPCVNFEKKMDLYEKGKLEAL